MDVKKLREHLPNYGYSRLIQDKLAETQVNYSQTYIKQVVNGFKKGNKKYYNADIIAAAIVVAKEYQLSLNIQLNEIKQLSECL
jgi:hypothetical protein